ncbi:hypothetical protein TNCV_2132591 [Trichonephila clavipes]|nr:hypothetical protein TNCV_2132591 [Trichonephila clavipes]
MNFFRGRCQGSHQELRKERGFSERTLDAEVDDPGLKKKRRERWPSRDPPNRCSPERRAGSWRRSYFERNNNPSKNKLEKSAAFKDDPDFVMNLLNLSVEDRHTKSEQQLQVINSQLELEKIKLKQIEREMELATGELLRDGTLIMYLDDIMIPATDEKEAYKKLARVLETDENIRDIKKLLPSSKTECILNNNVLFKISGKQELLVVPEMMQANVIKKVHSFRHFAVTKTGELFAYFRSLVREQGRCQGSHQKLTKERGFSERMLDADVDDPGLKKKRRERWPSRDPPNRCSQERRAGPSQHYRED